MTTKLWTGIGIDLGTTTSLVSYVDGDGQVRCLKLDGQQPIVPSALFFPAKPRPDQRSVLVGNAAIESQMVDFGRYAECFKRDMGKSHFHSPIANQKVPPEVLSAFVLEYLRETASLQLGELKSAVITVPAYYDDLRRYATQEAGRLAGWDVLAIINEPVAASIAIADQIQRSESFHGSSSGSMLGNKDKPKNILVYDLGGGTFDVSVLRIEGHNFITLATGGDVQLGGQDFDECLVKFLATKFQDRHGIDPRATDEGICQLYNVARQTKHALSASSSHLATWEYAGLRCGVDVMRREFEDQIDFLVKGRSINTTKEVMRSAGLGWGELDNVFLVGGSTRVPYVAREIEAITGIAPVHTDHPDELVARGAALYAASLLQQGNSNITPYQVINVNSRSLGVRGKNTVTNEEVNDIVIPRNTRLPVSRTRKYITYKDGQPSVGVRLLEGESTNPKNCIMLASCTIHLDPPLPKGTEVEVLLSYDRNGRIEVSAKIPSTMQSAMIDFNRERKVELESLDVWRKRLTTGEEANQVVSHSPNQSHHSEPSISNEPATESGSVERRDLAYFQLGKVSFKNQSTPHLQALPIYRQIDLLTNEIEKISAGIEALAIQIKNIQYRDNRRKPESDLLQLKLHRDEKIKLLNHYFLVLGRTFCAVNICPTGGEKYFEDIRNLMS